jgi:D-alanine-D-alanine ligase-like ATP-grasp enzyme
LALASETDAYFDLLSAHARYAARAAVALGYSFRSLDGADGYLFEVRDGARSAAFAAGAGTPYALNDARASSIARDKSFCAEVLSRAGLPTIPGRLFFVTERYAEMRGPGRELADARAFAAGAAYPLFCKPIAASNGQFAELITSAAAFEDYVARVGREHFAILVQPYVRATEHRVFVLEGRALFSYRKHLPRVIGDGQTRLRDLIAALPREHAAPLTETRARDAHGEPVALDAVPLPGVRVELEGPANRATGGGAAAPTDDVPAPLAGLGLKATAEIGLGLAGVDVFDRSAAGDLSDLVVIEVNSNPMIKTLEEHDRWDLIIAIWRANIEAALR